MNLISNMEKKLFPRESPYQRTRRRLAIIFSVIVILLLFWGTTAIVTLVTRLTGQ